MKLVFVSVCLQRRIVSYFSTCMHTYNVESNNSSASTLRDVRQSDSDDDICRRRCWKQCLFLDCAQMVCIVTLLVFLFLFFFFFFFSCVSVTSCSLVACSLVILLHILSLLIFCAFPGVANVGTSQSMYVPVTEPPSTEVWYVPCC